MEISVNEIINLVLIIAAIAVVWTILGLVLRLARFILGVGCSLIVLVGLVILFMQYFG